MNNHHLLEEVKTTVILDKIVTISKTFSKFTSVNTYKYKDLPNALKNSNRIIADYPYGQLSLRRKLLTNLGYELENTIWFNDEKPYSRIKEVYIRKEED